MRVIRQSSLSRKQEPHVVDGDGSGGIQAMQCAVFFWRQGSGLYFYIVFAVSEKRLEGCKVVTRHEDLLETAICSKVKAALRLAEIPDFTQRKEAR